MSTITITQVKNWMNKVIYERGKETLDEILYNAMVFYEDNIRLVEWSKVIDINVCARVILEGLQNQSVYVCLKCCEGKDDLVIVTSNNPLINRIGLLLPLSNQNNHGSFIHSLKHSFLGIV